MRSDMDTKAAIKLLKFAAEHPLNSDTFKKLSDIDWRAVCFADDVELDSIRLMSQAVGTQVSETRIHAVIANIVAPFFLGSPTTRAPGLTETEKFMFENIHEAVWKVCRQYPRSPETVTRSLCSSFPFYGTCPAHEFVSYVWNLLSISRQMDESHQKELLLFVMDRVYLLDVNTDPEDAEDAENQLKLEHVIGTIIEFIESSTRITGQVEEKRVKQLYDLLLPTFIQTVCPSSKLLQSMFCMFYLSSMTESVARQFCSDLWQVFESRTVDPIVVLGLLTSFCTKSVSVSCDVVIEILVHLANHCHTLTANIKVQKGVLRPEKYAYFYAAFQSLLYLIVLRSNDFPDPKILHILKITDLIKSQLQPLSVCTEGLTDAFTRSADQLHIALGTTPGLTNKPPSLDPNVTQDLRLVLQFHSNPPQRICQAIRPFVRPITDPDIIADSHVPDVSMSYDNKWTDAGVLDYSF